MSEIRSLPVPSSLLVRIRFDPPTDPTAHVQFFVGPDREHRQLAGELRLSQPELWDLGSLTRYTFELKEAGLEWEVDLPRPQPPARGPGWLPEDLLLPLTALEAGALRTALEFARAHGLGFDVSVPDAPEPLDMCDVLLRKLEAARQEAYGDA